MKTRAGAGRTFTAGLILGWSGGWIHAGENHPFVPIARIQSTRLKESSGIVKSRRYADIFWSHNDSGNPPALFAIRLTGEVVVEIPLEGGTNSDWEDIAIDAEGRLYIGDFGDNSRNRSSLRIYVLPEPDPFAIPLRAAKPTQVLTYQLPDAPADCEAAFTFKGNLHVITKEVLGRTAVYRLESAGANRLTATRIAVLPWLLVTSASISADEKKLAVLNYGQLVVYPLEDEIAKLDKATPKIVTFPLEWLVEACSFDGDDIVITAESRQIWRITASEIESQCTFINP